jgi:hypothetical protein
VVVLSNTYGIHLLNRTLEFTFDGSNCRKLKSCSKTKPSKVILQRHSVSGSPVNDQPWSSGYNKHANNRLSFSDVCHVNGSLHV